MLTFRAHGISGDIPLVVRTATSVEATAYSAARQTSGLKLPLLLHLKEGEGRDG